MEKTDKPCGEKELNPKMEALKRLEEIVKGFAPIENPEEELQKARDEKYGGPF